MCLYYCVYFIKIGKTRIYTWIYIFQLCDIISKWETALREKGSGKFENTRVIQLTYKSRCYWRQAAKMETDKERLLLCYQVNQQVVQGKFPLNRELAFELASLMAQVHFT